jgi:hypothetical protein
LAPAWWPSASGEGAAFVPHDEGAAHRAVDQASFPSDVEDLAGAVERDGEDFGVAGQQPHLAGAELGAVVQAAGAPFGADRVAQLLVVDGDHDLGPVPTVVGEFAAGVGQLADLDQGVGPPLPRRAGVRPVVGRPWCAQWVQGGA